MSLPITGKIVGAGITVVGVPATIYFVNEYFSLYEVESKVLEEDVLLSVTQDTGTGKGLVKVTTATSKLPEGYKWECFIKKKGDPSESEKSFDKSELESKLREKLPTQESNKTSKLENKRRLVEACSKNRSKDDSSKSVSASVEFSISKKSESENKWKFEETEFNSFFPS